jgi:heat-inducible transcriptional repressor
MSSHGSGRASTPRPLLSERDRRILGSLVSEYIERGEPVSSLWLAEHSGLGVSSATVRNVLAALEETGYVRQPHTSAGRVPTDLAYRCYVDQILEGRRPARPAPTVEARLRQAGSVEDVLDSVSQELSRSSHHLGFALVLACQKVTLKHVEFVSLGPTRVLVVIVATSGQVFHKPVTVSEPLTASDLRQGANFLNEEFGGLPLDAVREALSERMQEDRAQYDRLLGRILELAAGSLDSGAPQGQLYVHGTSSLVDSDVEAETGVSMARLRVLLTMIEEKHRLIQLLTAYVEGPGVTVVIGGEHLSPELRGFSLVASTYDGGSDTAAVGVIGPTRMRYSRAISTVDSLAQVLGRILTDSIHPGA